MNSNCIHTGNEARGLDFTALMHLQYSMCNTISQHASKGLARENILLRYFLILFVFSLTIVGCISLSFYFTSQHSRQKAIERQEISSLSQQEIIIRNDIKAIIADLLVLVNHHHLHSKLERNTDSNFDTVAEEFLIFARQKKIYDQVRFIDHTGMEQIRVNYNDGAPSIVPIKKLQFKGDRYYFKDTLKLRGDEIFISPFDLNIEQGVIEEPKKPMIRFGAPVFNCRGEKFGIIVINYMGVEILNDIKELKKHTLGHRSLLNRDGYWLMGPDREKEWGFMYTDRSNISFRHHFPEAWKNIKQNDSGLFYKNGDMYVFNTIYPLEEGLKSSTGSPEAYHESVKNLFANNYYWKIISHIPEKELTQLFHPNKYLYLQANVLLALLIGIGCWFIASFRIKHLQAEQNVKESEQKFRTIADYSYDWDAWLKPDGCYAYISPSCERITGYSPKCFLDNPGFFLEIIHPDDRERLRAHRLKHLDHAYEKDEIYFRITMKSGEIRWIWHLCHAVYAENGEWLGRRTTNRDITEKHKMETALQRERDMFLRGPVVTFTWLNEENWPVEQVSANVADILGYEAEEFIDGSVLYTECIHPDDLEKVIQKLMTHSNNGNNSIIHPPYRLISRSGETIWVLDTTSIVRNSKGEVTHYLAYLVDISEQKRQEQLVLENSKQQEELKRLESLKTMAGAIAHRFNNAMMAVQGNLDLMTLTLPSDSNVSKMASDAAQAAKGASQVGSMMLSYVGQNPLHLREVSLAELVKESIDALKSAFPSTTTLTITLPPQPLYCSVDQQQIKEVIESILTNASEALEGTRGTIEVSFGNEYFATDSFSIPFRSNNLQDGMYTFCQIKDSGHGINPKNLSRIFEPFYSTKFVGRGLGLALTVGIMQSHHGAIIVKSPPAQGTTVRMLLPSISSTPQMVSSSGRFQAKTIQLSGTILLADDNKMVLDVGKKMLEVLGFKVHTAVNGLEAVEKIGNKNIHFCGVILDISMPDMDGIEAMKVIKKSNTNLPVLLSSGYSEDEFPFEEDETIKPDGFLSKPFQLSALQSNLEKLLTC
jgi:PAS domain S-box-containing protein